MKLRVIETREYDRFELHEFNRNVTKTKELEISMRKHGWIPAYPMHVVKNGNGKLKIKGGHHRFVVAKTLGLAVKYVVCNDSATIHELEKGSVKWTVTDYLVSFSRAGNPSYQAVKEFCERTGIGVACAISMLAGETAGSHNHDDRFKAGTYRISANQEHAKIVGDTILFLRNQGIDWAGNYLFVQALSKMTWCSEFDHEAFRKKSKANKALFVKQPNKDAYLGLIEQIYNRGSKAKVPLAFLANETAKKRNVVLGNNEKS